MKSKLIMLLITITIISCRKVNRSNPAMLGVWIHYAGGGDYEKITINANGKGYYYYFHTIEDANTDKHTWLVVADELHFKRRKSVIFKINEFPTKAEKDILHKYDTIGAGYTYMKLNQNYFKKIK